MCVVARARCGAAATVLRSNSRATHSSDDVLDVTDRFLIAGVITAAPNFNQRSWIRRHYDAIKPPGVSYFFVLGNMSTC